MDQPRDHRREDTEQLLKVAARLGRLGGWAVDLQDPRPLWSDDVCAILEVPPGFRPGLEQAFDFYAPEHRALAQETFARCASEGTPFACELQVITARGRRVWVHTVGEARRDRQGRIVRVEGAFQDISALKALADERQKLADHLTVTLDSLADCFFVMDHDWRITYVNPEAAKIAGRPREVLIGRRLWDLFPAALGSAFEHAYGRAMRERATVEIVDYFAPLGLWARARAWPTPEGIAVSFVDITAQKAAEAELLRLNRELEQRVRRRTARLEAATRELQTFSYAIAHDVRAPLAAINGFSRALEETEAAALSERGRHYLARIRAATERMDAMTEGILQLARLTREPSARQEVDLSALAEEMWRTLAAQDSERAVAVRIQPGLRTRGHPAQLALVLQNLLGNAWKFTARSPAARVEFTGGAGAPGEQVFVVRDNGAGFDPALAQTLFRPFRRLHTADEFPGTGLGLATVQKVVELHGGRAWAEGVPGQGASFYFSLAEPAA
jgi:PAS domain S-box-containing protein